ncbi:MAG: hypothetical protein ABIR15_20725 [Chitinophagaceae bacterium]
MKGLILLLSFFIYRAGQAQNIPVSNEDFVNSISRLVVDSSFSHYYLSGNAAPCSFKKFDYDEWYKYGLTEDVPIYILNELAKKSFLDAAPHNWQQEELLKAFCIDEEKAKLLLKPPLKRHAKNQHLTIDADKIVYYFSRPEFTDDYQYAIIDMSFRCDDRQCGMGATFLFKQVNGKWIVAGKKILWSS